MNQNIINYYENYKEEDRLTTNNARKIEFLTTIHFFEKHFHGKLKILDCAAGTGTYAFYLADKGHQLTATWLEYHLSVCSEKAVIDMSNHALIMGQKR